MVFLINALFEPSIGEVFQITREDISYHFCKIIYCTINWLNI